ncbi:MAG: pyridoxal phosphate-dependent decarboxylase family protein [Anaerolineae bacterium]
MTVDRPTLPEKGRPKKAVLAEMKASRGHDVAWREGKVFSLVFYAGEEAGELLKEAYNLFFSENALNPTAFPSLRRFETEVVGMSAALLGGDEAVVGNMTSGGTESILMAVLAAREWARANRPDIGTPEIILPTTGHPAFDKAGHYFGVQITHVPVDAGFRADIEATRRAITPDTIMLVGSAPSYPQGVVDPIRKLAQLAQDNQLLCHVDACVGGFMLPFVRQLGYAVPDFDFSVPGVTSMSADLHKYGYAAKGASVILYRNGALRRHQLFAFMDWPGGIYASPTLSGTRPGGTIAAAWAIMNHLGREGYLAIARQVMETVDRVKESVRAMEGIRILGDPAMSLLAIGSDTLNIYEVGDELGLRGWHLDRQHYPPSLHLTINHAHVARIDAFLEDLAAAVQAVRRPSIRRAANGAMLAVARAAVNLLPRWLVTRLTSRASLMVGPKGVTMPKRSAPMYGMMGALPNRGDLKEVVLDLVEQFTQPQ